MKFIKQLSTANWIKGIAQPVAYLKAEPRDLALSHGIQFDYEEGDDGLGDREMALLNTRSEKPFGLIRYVSAPRNSYTAIMVGEKLKSVTELVNEIMIDLELRSTDFCMFDLRKFRFTPCKLLREDDYGTQIVIGEFDCIPDAYFQQNAFEVSGHKQTYYIRESEAKPKGWTGSWKEQEMTENL